MYEVRFAKNRAQGRDQKVQLFGPPQPPVVGYGYKALPVARST